ncbi:AAA family ATPase [Pseudonocardia hydrocarbonoxydans]|uniref:Uncharacterized protein n=1 Tax=Pseudonocardia hydrocarbonoxydans TaxID=76726 RepID=A0A4Y3WW15_9PSEU|nr:AAA family ATPase [Pseudonocardia hydrocarbonoxydans]GEC22954.1 hypothetical protein PHY01_52370 [Pseudonocardia hydrocarbonoxydans]
MDTNTHYADGRPRPWSFNECPPHLSGEVREAWPVLTPAERSKVLDRFPAPVPAFARPWHLVLAQRATAEDRARQAELDRQDKITSRLEILEVDSEARRLLAERNRPKRRPRSERLIDSNDVENVPAPRWRMAGLIPCTAIGFLGGAYGTYKSFVAVSWACSVAAGRAWLDRPEFAVTQAVNVLYIAAEGWDGIAHRVAAWRRLNGALEPGALTIHNEPLHLNSGADVDELIDLVRELNAGLVVIDTMHRSIPGAEENSATEVGVAIEAAARLRDELGASVLLLDHTGHDGRRLRGSSAKGSDADFVLMIDLAGDARSSTSQRTLRVEKFKNAPVEGRWPLRLRTVPGHDAMVVDIGEEGDASPTFDLGHEWWKHDVPDGVADLFAGQAGRRAAFDIVRVLAMAGDQDGLSGAEIRAALADGLQKHSRSSITAGIALVKNTAVAEHVNGTTRLALALRWMPPHADRAAS